MTEGYTVKITELNPIEKAGIDNNLIENSFLEALYRDYFYEHFYEWIGFDPYK